MMSTIKSDVIVVVLQKEFDIGIRVGDVGAIVYCTASISSVTFMQCTWLCDMVHEV